MIKLQAYRSQTRALMLVSHLITAAATSLIWYALVYIFDFDSVVVVPAAMGLGLIVGGLFAIFIEETVVGPMKTLTQAILYVAKHDQESAAPRVKGLFYGRKMLHEAINTLYEIAAVSSKVHEKVKSEHSYMHALLNSSPLPVIVLDKNQRIRFYNQAAGKFVHDSVPKPIGKEFDTAFNLSFPSDKTLSIWIKDCQANKIKDTETWERVKLVKNDDVHMFDMIANYSKNDSNGIETMITMFDHSDRYQADDSQVSFVSLAVHELRAPITVLRGYIEVFEDELAPKLTDEQKIFMYKMRVAASQLTTFVNNILNVVRVDSDQMNLHLVEGDWNQIVKNTYEDLSQRASLRGRILKLSLPERLPTVAVDNISIYEVLANLIDNAIKYSYDNGQIIVKAYEKDGMIETTIQDFGIGIPGNVVEHLFDKFYRSHRSRDNIGGTGLGLYLCKAIIKAHGGTIWVRSAEGKGTTFGFTLPIYANVKAGLKDKDKSEIIRGAHGWIKNHAMVRKGSDQ